MGVEVFGIAQEIDGHGDAMEAFRTANNSNAAMLLNVSEKKKKNAPRPVYDPRHPDNGWPKMVYSAERGELVVGKSLVGVEDQGLRKRIVAENEAAIKEAFANGYRTEPYIKPRVAVLDPAVEKAEMLRKNQEMEGRIVALTDLVTKLAAQKA